MQQKEKPPLLVNVYAEADSKDFEQWEKQLRPLEKAKLLRAQSKKNVEIGDTRREQLHQQLKQAQLVILLLSPDFFDSEECVELMNLALQRSQKRQVRVILLLLRDVSWSIWPGLDQLTYLPGSGQPVTGGMNPDTNFYICARELDGILKETQGNQPHNSIKQQPFTQLPVTLIENIPSTNDIRWESGATISIQHVSYILHTFTGERHAEDRSYTYRQARAHKLSSGKDFVWLRQVYIRNSTPEAIQQWKKLEKEHKLLLELKEFLLPQIVQTQADRECFTLVVSVPRARSWQERFLPSQKSANLHNPLDASNAHLLLKSILPLCQILYALHQKGYAHRALSPENILWPDRSQIPSRYPASTVLDLGLATLLPARPGEGDSPYQAPEQERLQRGKGKFGLPGPHTDIYRLGAILYHLLTGRYPLVPQGGSLIPPSIINQGLSSQLDEILLKALMPPDQRWSNILAFAHALRKVRFTEHEKS